ncbi:hypothetical protein EV182_002544 [Spiromyces aspiralis]|uniref:Uncharacterized protein n=1 Tax=Spiromyces aspiralis TaxID=68401 RepID=A0ACC1HEN0_9FUNG|nr:hypothetical protein EV182_002544 [Spiromyces aspiralis]
MAGAVSLSRLILTILSVLAALTLISAQQNQQQHASGCETLRVRKELLDLTDSELKAFVNALLQLYENGVIASLTERHYNGAIRHSTIHGTDHFLPWHRRLLLEFERELQRIDPSLTVPYWDWTVDSQKPMLSVAFQDDYFGGDGDSRNDHCVASGPLAQVEVSYPSRHCLRRWLGGTDGLAQYSFSSIEAVVETQRNFTTFHNFATVVETSMHAYTHNWIGGLTSRAEVTAGDMSSNFSPNDVFFFLHHAMIDKIWYDWQSEGDGRFSEYSTLNGHSLDEPLYSFDGETVWDVMDPRNAPRLCYVYQRSRADMAFEIAEQEATRSAAGVPSNSFNGSEGDKGGENDIWQEGDGDTQPQRRASSLSQLQHKRNCDSSRGRSDNSSSKVSNGQKGGIFGSVDSLFSGLADAAGSVGSVVNEGVFGEHGSAAEDTVVGNMLSNIDGAIECLNDAVRDALASVSRIADALRLADVDIRVLKPEERKIATPPEISKAWIEMNGLNVEEARQAHEFTKWVTKKYNSNPRWYSPSVIYHAAREQRQQRKHAGD